MTSGYTNKISVKKGRSNQTDRRGKYHEPDDRDYTASICVI